MTVKIFRRALRALEILITVILALLLAALMALSLAACGAKGVGKMGSEPKSLEEAVAMHKELMAEETAIFSENTALWEKVFMEADKGMAMVEDGKNYGEFLLDTIEGSKDQFTEDELKLLKEGAEKIRDIETQLTMIEEKYPEERRIWYEDVAHCKIPGGESVAEMAERVNAAFERIAAENDGKTVFVATHFTPIRAMCCRWHGWPLDGMQKIKGVVNASVTIVEYDGDKRKIVCVGEAEHLVKAGLLTGLPKDI